MIKIFQIDECTWYAGETAKECLALHLKDYDGDPDTEKYYDPVELSPGDLQRLMIRDPDSDDEKLRKVGVSFQAELSRLISIGAEFPRFFASTEY